MTHIMTRVILIAVSDGFGPDSYFKIPLYFLCSMLRWSPFLKKGESQYENNCIIINLLHY